MFISLTIYLSLLSSGFISTFHKGEGGQQLRERGRCRCRVAPPSKNSQSPQSCRGKLSLFTPKGENVTHNVEEYALAYAFNHLSCFISYFLLFSFGTFPLSLLLLSFTIFSVKFLSYRLSLFHLLRISVSQSISLSHCVSLSN